MRLDLERAERLEVEVALLRLGIEECDVTALQLGRRVLGAEHPVARELDLQLERPGLCTPRQHGVGPLAVAARVQPLQDAAVAPERRLALRDEEQVDATPAPLLRHGRANAEPVRRPERPEALAQHGGPVVERLRLLPGDAIDRRAHEHVVGGARFCIDALAHALRDLLEPLARVAEVADHEGSPGFASTTEVSICRSGISQ